MANVDWLKDLRALGVKRAVFSEQSADGAAKLLEVEFFPLSAFDRAGALVGNEDDEPEARAERDTEAPPAVNVPPAMARVLQRGSVS